MKNSLVLAALAASASAFPAMLLEGDSDLVQSVVKRANQKRQLGAVVSGISATAPQGAGFLPLTPPAFDPVAQRVQTTGQYAFVPPSSSDARGMCPGLNALANHNYLPHNGVATIQQFIDATNQGFGMAEDLGGFLALYGALIDGSGTGWSILGGPHVGIGGSHNDYEGDSSPCKSDLNQYGSNYKMVIHQFQELYSMQPDNPATSNYNLEVLTAFRGKRYQESISQNPYFAYLPFTGIEVSQAAFTFMYRFMANKSAEYPEGILNTETLKSFEAISGTSGHFTWNYGHERFPNVFYKRNVDDEYSIPYFESDIVAMAVTQPEILVLGCNQGEVNTFTAIDPVALTGGAYTLKSLAANPLCFATNFALAEASGFTGLSAAQLSTLNSSVQAINTNLKCPPISKVNATALSVCPGLSFYGGPTGPVAPGAIQYN